MSIDMYIFLFLEFSFMYSNASSILLDVLMLFSFRNLISSGSIFLVPIRIMFCVGNPFSIIALRNSSCVGSCCGGMQSAWASNTIRNESLFFSWNALKIGYVIEWSPPMNNGFSSWLNICLAFW